MSMRYPMMVLLGCWLVFGSCRCEKDDDDNNSIRIEGFLLVDNFGNSMGEIGSADDDWTLYNSLSAREMALFNFNTPFTLDNTSEANIMLAPQPYPNPASFTQSYVTNVSDSVLLKVVVVDSDLDVLQTASFKIKTFASFMLDYSDRTKFPNKTSYRVYYSFSAQNKPNFKVGYGDIRICDGSTSGTSADCF